MLQLPGLTGLRQFITVCRQCPIHPIARNAATIHIRAQLSSYAANEDTWRETRAYEVVHPQKGLYRLHPPKPDNQVNDPRKALTGVKSGKMPPNAQKLAFFRLNPTI